MEKTVPTQNTFAEERDFVESEIDVVVQELKDKKKGSIDHAVILFDRIKALINRFGQEQIKAYKIKKIDNLKAEELKLREANSSKERVDDALKVFFEEVITKSSEVLVHKIESVNAAVAKQVVDSAEDVIKVCDRFEPKLEETKVCMNDLMRNNKVVNKALAVLVEGKGVATKIESLNEDDISSDNEEDIREGNRKVHNMSTSEDEVSDEEASLEKENEMRKRLRKESKEEEEMAEAEDKMRKRLLKEYDQKEIAAIEEFNRTKARREKKSDSKLEKTHKKESQAEMEMRIKQELEFEEDHGRFSDHGFSRSRGRGGDNTRRGSNGFKRGRGGELRGAGRGFNNPSYHSERRYHEDGWSRSPWKDRRSMSARRNYNY